MVSNLIEIHNLSCLTIVWLYVVITKISKIIEPILKGDPGERLSYSKPPYSGPITRPKDPIEELRPKPIPWFVLSNLFDREDVSDGLSKAVPNVRGIIVIPSKVTEVAIEIRKKLRVCKIRAK